MAFRARTGKLIFGGVCSVGIGFGSITLMPNTIFLDKIKEVVQMYRSGSSMPISPNTDKIIDKVMNDMQISPDERKCIKPFTVYGFDMFHAGYTGSGFGAIIGIPSNFYYKSVEEVQTDSITVRNEQIDWATDAAKSFKECLVLSENAQKFLIAREIASVHVPQMFLKSLYPVFSVFLVYSLSYKFNRKFLLLQRPLMLRLVMYSLVSIFSLGVWAFLQDITTFQFEMEADRKACSLGEDYLKGGLEAYSQIQQRNISLRELMGSAGPSTFSSTGNNIYFFRQKHAPITLRKELLETVASSCKKEESKTADSIDNAPGS